MISNLKCVDEVLIINGDAEVNIAFEGLRTVKPDVYVRTSEVNSDTLSEEVKLCRELNIQMVILNRDVKSRFKCSSEIIKYILENFKLSDVERLITKNNIR